MPVPPARVKETVVLNIPFQTGFLYLGCPLALCA